MAYPKGFLPDDVIAVSSATISVTTAGTTVLIGSYSTGSIYVMGVNISNGVSAGSVYLGASIGAVAPTGSAILVNELFMGQNGVQQLYAIQPFKVPANRNLVITALSCTTLTAFAMYYIAP